MTLINLIGAHFHLNICCSHCPPPDVTEFKSPRCHRYQTSSVGLLSLAVFDNRWLNNIVIIGMNYWIIIKIEQSKHYVVIPTRETTHNFVSTGVGRYINECGWTVGPGKRESRKTCTAVSSGGGLECMYNI